MAHSFAQSARGTKAHAGFTLVELSIVVIVVGLIIGGILVGKDVIRAAGARAQIAQIEKYNAAVSAFRFKYGGLPGDLNNTAATQFGLVTTNCDGVTQGKRNGDGLLQGYVTYQMDQGFGETALFWQDLSVDNFIDQTFPNGGDAAMGCTGGWSLTTPATIARHFPVAKIPNYVNHLYVYSYGTSNWFGLSQITSISTNGQLFSTPNLPVAIAYNIDVKIDDGLPTTGNVQAVYQNTSTQYPQTPTNATTDSYTTCYNSNTGAYSMSQAAKSASANCALSFRFP